MATTTAGQVAAELRRVAEALEKQPELPLNVYLSIQPAAEDKETFLALAKVMPRPMEKSVDFPGTDYEDFVLKHDFWRIKVPRKSICVMVEPARPARYECPSILSAEEEESLGVF